MGWKGTGSCRKAAGDAVSAFLSMVCGSVSRHRHDCASIYIQSVCVSASTNSLCQSCRLFINIVLYSLAVSFLFGVLLDVASSGRKVTQWREASYRDLINIPL